MTKLYRPISGKTLWPLGSIFLSVNNANPSSWFGGTWEAIAEGRCLIGAGSIKANSDNWCGTVTAGNFVAYAGTSGGEITHKLSVDEMPQHLHDRIYAGGNNDWPLTNSHGLSDGTGIVSTPYAIMNTDTQQWGATNRSVYKTGYTGGNANHNNLPPYLVVYIWKRTA